MRRWSMTRRLIALLTLGTTVLWCIAAAISAVVVYDELNEAFDTVLQETAQGLLPLAVDDSGEVEEEARALRQLSEAERAYVAYQILNTGGRVILRSHNAPVIPFTDGRGAGFSNVGSLRLFVVRAPEQGLSVAVAENTAHRREALLQSLIPLFLPLALLVPLGALAIWFAVRDGLKPLIILRDEISERGGSNLAPIETAGLPAELEPIAGEVDLLMERLRAALDAERAFAANSAHELRTPIAGALAQVQLLLGTLKSAQSIERAREVEATLKRLGALAEKLLQLSRIDAGLAMRAEATDLLPVLGLVVSDYRQWAGLAERIDYLPPEEGQLVAPMDPDAFYMVARNLIDNALAHGEPGGRVTVRVTPDRAVQVINGGPSVPPAELDALKTRFKRGADSHNGAGLGLAIVDTIMTKTGGALELYSPARGQSDGFEAVARLGCPDKKAPHIGGA